MAEDWASVFGLNALSLSPAFDDADTRRGKPSVQKRFGESIAILAGDALILLAFEELAHGASHSSTRLPELTKTLAQ